MRELHPVRDLAPLGAFFTGGSASSGQEIAHQGDGLSLFVITDGEVTVNASLSFTASQGVDDKSKNLTPQTTLAPMESLFGRHVSLITPSGVRAGRNTADCFGDQCKKPVIHPSVLKRKRLVVSLCNLGRGELFGDVDAFSVIESDVHSSSLVASSANVRYLKISKRHILDRFPRSTLSTLRGNAVEKGKRFLHTPTHTQM